MRDLFHINTARRAMWFGYYTMFVFLGVFSLIGLVAGDPGVSGKNVVACAAGAVIGGLAGYFTKENHVKDLKAQGKLDPDSDGSELPAVQPPSTIPRLITYVLLLTLMIQGGIAFLTWLGQWSSGTGWDSWAITLSVVTAVGLVAYLVGKKTGHLVS